jgi:hypothetical protein
MIIFGTLITLAAIFMDNRACPQKQSIDRGVCVDCLDPENCLSCEIYNYDRCTDCIEGMYVDPEGKCQSCDGATDSQGQLD